MDSPGGPVSKPSAEVRLDVFSKTMEISRASEEGCKPTSFEDNQRITDQLETKEVHVKGSSEGLAIDQASQDGRTPTLFQVYLRITNQSEAKEIFVDVSSKGIVTDKASQDGCQPTEVMLTPVVDEKYRPLFEAAQKGDWKTVKKMLKKDSQAMTAAIMNVENKPVTVLDVAIMAAQDELVKNLIELILVEDKNFNFSIFLQRAARGGRIKMVKALLNKVNDDNGSVCNALRIATRCAPRQREVIWYMAKRTNYPPMADTIPNLIMAGHSDVALYLAQIYKDSVLHAQTDSILKNLANMESSFCSGVRRKFWESLWSTFEGFHLCLVDTSFKIPPGAGSLLNTIRFRHRCSVELANLVLTEMKSRMETPTVHELLLPIVFDAASRGISEIVKLCFEHFPELTWNESITTELIKTAVNGRHVELFRLLNAPGTIPFSTVETTRNDVWMKAVAEWSPGCLPRDVFGAPFLVQRELQWFKVLNDTRERSSKTGKIKEIPVHYGLDYASKSWRLPGDKKPYWNDFVENRKQLLQEAREWMRNTASSCSLVSALIITVTFAAIFTVLRGNDDKTESLIFQDDTSFVVFAVADAFAFSFSFIATLMFLAILTSRYAAEDFLISLPTKMLLGLTFLFLSLTLMLVSFGSTVTFVLKDLFDIEKPYPWVFIPLMYFATILVTLFAILQLPLYFEMLKSTYWPRLYRPVKLWK